MGYKTQNVSKTIRFPKTLLAKIESYQKTLGNGRSYQFNFNATFTDAVIKLIEIGLEQIGKEKVK